MSQIKTLNGVQYTLPQFSDIGWGANTGNVLTQYIAAIADVTLQLSGGSFTLTADVNFGATYGLVSSYFTSRTASAASAGAIRLAKTDVINWRNNAGGGNISLSKNTSDELLWNSSRIILAGGGLIVNADISASAAIAYSKLALTGSIVNADIGASAAIAYSKLALSASIVNADVASGAAIAYSKLALTSSIVNGDMVAGTLTNAAINASAAIALTKLAALSSHSRALASDSSGFIVESSVTATELGYVSGVSSAIQTQLGTKALTDLSNVASVSANVPMNSKKFTGLAAGSTNGDSVRYEQLPAVSGTITNWAAYTPTITGCGTVNTVTFGWRRVGSDIQVRGLWLCGTVAASAITISLPNSVTVDGSVIAYDMAGTLMQSRTGVTLSYPIRASGTSNTVDVGKGATGTQFSSFNGNDILTTGDAVYVQFSCPITGWSI